MIFDLIPSCTVQVRIGSEENKTIFYIDLDLLPLGIRENFIKFIIMKKILLLLLVIFCFNISGIFAQEENPKKRTHILAEYGLKRHSLEYYVLGGSPSDNISTSGIGTYDIHFGTAIRFSSNWYFSPENKNRWYFRTNWIMGGIVWADGILFPNAPLNIGIGDNIQLSREVSLDLSISGGLVLIGPGILNDYIEPIGAIYPEIKLQTKWITIGLIYSRYADRYKFGQTIYHTLLLGLSRGI